MQIKITWMIAMPNDEIKTVIGSRRKIRDAINELVADRKPVFDVDVSRSGFYFIAVISTGEAIA